MHDGYARAMRAMVYEAFGALPTIAELPDPRHDARGVQCAVGNHQICDRQIQPGFTQWGSFAERVALENADVNLVAIPDGVEIEGAALLGCRFATAKRFPGAPALAIARPADGQRGEPRQGLRRRDRGVSAAARDAIRALRPAITGGENPWLQPRASHDP
jgi:hypothetical protein